MNKLSKVRVHWIVISLAMVMSLNAFAKKRALGFSAENLAEIMSVAQSIHVLIPHLDDTKYMEYAVGIFKASKRYQIEPAILVSIAMQETGFRENLPEGAAGEHGICQIRKMWLKNPKFIAEFKTQAIADLDKPVKNFLFAAWILKDLKKNAPKGSLPYWSYYNSVRFENRFRYFLAVNRNIASLLRAGKAEPVAAPVRVVAVAETPVAKPAPVLAAVAPVATTPRKESVLNRAAFSSDVQELMSEGGHWIPDALRRIQKQKEDKKAQERQALNLSFTREIASHIEKQLEEPVQD